MRKSIGIVGCGDDSIKEQIQIALTGYDYDCVIIDDPQEQQESINLIPEEGNMFNNRMKRIMLAVMGGLAHAIAPTSLYQEAEMREVLGKYRHQGKGRNKQGATKPSGAAQLKRAASKRSNIRKRSKK